MARRAHGWVAPHGTMPRARWHYRQGHKPLRQYCPACADANALYYKLLKARKRKKRHG
jgi:hypothetical protein